MRYLLAILVCTFGVFTFSTNVYADAQMSAEFSCGPYMDTYVVTSVTGVKGTGIRCVKMSTGFEKNPAIPYFVWYGEGTWGSCSYRHVGQAFFEKAPKDGRITGSASDLFGNGECYKNSFNKSLVIQVKSMSGDISVRGAWNEDWKRVERASYTPLPPPKTCGAFFQEYRATSNEGASRDGDGLRCLMTAGLGGTTWYGVGSWNGVAYAHLATGSSKGYGASDFCQNKKDFCNNFDYGTIRRRLDRQRMKIVIDGWDEVWTRR